VTRRLLLLCVVILVAFFSTSQEAAAQGRGRPKAPRAPKGSPSAPAAAPAAPAVSAPVQAPTLSTVAPVVSFRQFGSWLDDASASGSGEGRSGIGIGYWRVNGGSQVNVPMLDVGYGITDRISASASVPFYRSSYEGGVVRGLDDMYVAGKITLIDPALTVSEFGVAVSPIVEVLSPGSSGGRTHYALPVSVEVRRQPFRVFGSAGYFSRGSTFAGGALEWSAPAGYVVTGALTQSYSTGDDATLDSLGVSRKRADVTGSIGYPLGQFASAYVSVGRSLTSIDHGGTAFSLAGGVSFRFTTARATP
jgi:hypothetical protein